MPHEVWVGVVLGQLVFATERESVCVCVLTDTPAPVRMRMRFLVRNKSTTSCGELYALNRSRSRRLGAVSR